MMKDAELRILVATMGLLRRAQNISELQLIVFFEQLADEDTYRAGIGRLGRRGNIDRSLKFQNVTKPRLIGN